MRDAGVSGMDVGSGTGGYGAGAYEGGIREPCARRGHEASDFLASFAGAFEGGEGEARRVRGLGLPLDHFS